jgi:F-type H+-transporting ATPase subunit a
MNKRIALFFGLLVATATSTAWAEDSHDHGHEQEAFNPSNFIIHHIADAHEIHLWGDVHIPLPIIVYTAEHGLDVFMSSAFEGHGDGRVAERPSGVTYELSHGHIAVAGDHAGHDHGSHDGHDHADHTGHDHDAHEGHDHAEHNHHGPVVYDLSITKSIFGMLLMLGLMVVLFGRMAGSYKNRQGQAPTGMTNALEPLVVFLRDEIAIPNIGKAKADKFLPFLMTVFFFIFFANLLGLVPFIGGFNVTGTLGITMVLASLVFLITAFNGNKHYWGHLFWPPGVPLFVMPIIVPIEIVGMFLKPIVLMIRLTANISAGHIIILSFVSLILIFGKGGEAMAAGYGIGIFSTAFMIFMYCLELLVAFLQAFVFTLLAAIYFGEATHEAHH